MDKQAKEARKMARELPWRQKIPYIWMYYKVWILSITALVLAVGITTYQVVTRPTYDLEISFYSEKILKEESIAELEQYLAQFIEDVDGDGEKTVRIYTNFASMAGGGEQGMMVLQTKLLAELSAGEQSAYLFDDFFGEMIQKGDYAGSMEVLRDTDEISGFREQFQLSDDVKLYWGTRALYEREMEKEKKVSAHEMAVQAEHELFGERSETAAPQEK